jgi:hypothetical protein
MPKRSASRPIRSLFLTISITLLFLEILARSLLSSFGLTTPTAPQEIEDPSNSPRFTFDPASGYRITPQPIRWAFFEPSGALQSVGTIQGNNLGFHDLKSFHPKRTHPGRPRVAVLGDSMSAGVYLPTPWPQRVEEISHQLGRPMEILNFSVDGAGIMNWWGIVTKLIAKEKYELDACIFAVCCDDLSRGFFIRHDDFDGQHHQHWFARVKGLRPQDLPSNLDQARKHAFWLGDALGLTTQQMNDRLRHGRPVQPELTRSALLQAFLLAAVMGHFQPQGVTADGLSFNNELSERIQEIRQSLDQLAVPILVVQIPMINRTHHQEHLEPGIAPLTQQFADKMNATSLAGGLAFVDIPAKQSGTYFLKGDPHWNQKGADLFAQFMEEQIVRWLHERTTHQPNAKRAGQ